MKTHSMGWADTILVLGFLTTFKLVCVDNHVLEGAVVWAMPLFGADRATSSFNSRIVQRDWNQALQPLSILTDLYCTTLSDFELTRKGQITYPKGAHTMKSSI